MHNTLQMTTFYLSLLVHPVSSFSSSKRPSLIFEPKNCFCHLSCSCTPVSLHPAMSRLLSLPGAVGSAVTTPEFGSVGAWLCGMWTPDPVIHGERLAASTGAACGCFWRYTYVHLACCQLHWLNYLVHPDSDDCGLNKKTREKSCKLIF